MASILTITLYAAAWLYMLNTLLRKKQNVTTTHLLGVIACGVLAHAAAVYIALLQPQNLALDFFNVSLLFFFVINVLVLLSSLRKPLHNLFIFLLPLSILALIVEQMLDTPAAYDIQLNAGMLGHILLSILAYSLLMIASFQALLLGYQNKQLKEKHFQVVRGLMPPLQTMESLLFDIVWAGFIFLTLSILTGVIYIDDIFAQQLSHKTVFSVLSWLIYAVLLAGHQVQGWRGAAAVRWVLGGFVALMLAYFGSKLVIEVILAAN